MDTGEFHACLQTLQYTTHTHMYVLVIYIYTYIYICVCVCICTYAAPHVRNVGALVHVCVCVCGCPQLWTQLLAICNSRHVEFGELFVHRKLKFQAPIISYLLYTFVQCHQDVISFHKWVIFESRTGWKPLAVGISRRSMGWEWPRHCWPTLFRIPKVACRGSPGSFSWHETLRSRAWLWGSRWEPVRGSV